MKTLAGTLAGRYDRYSFAGRNDGKFTYNGGLEWRPVTQLLLRANHATSFRAPDMNYIYEARGSGYYASTTDYYRCAKAGQPVSGGDYANYSPGADFDVSLDYRKIGIDDLVANLVANLSAHKPLRDEADCRIAGDLASPTCADAIALAARYVLRTAACGSFTTRVNYSKTLTRESRQFAGDPLNDDCTTSATPTGATS